MAHRKSYVSRFFQQVQIHGPIAATKLFARVAVSRAKVVLANKLLPARVACPCCGWRGRRFNDYIQVGHRVNNATCPQCASHSRHRSLFLWASRQFNLAEKSGRALVFAPEKATATLWSEAPCLSVWRVDLEAGRGVDLLVEIRALPFASDSIDLIWCHHVLEHVENDLAAIRELGRVLRPGTGELIVSVPMGAGAATEEYGFPDPSLSGHWRLYGFDFVDRLAEGGLSVSPIDSKVSAEERRLYAIEPKPCYVCRKAETSAAAANGWE
ncbi:MAG TPA: class I SAM-dependent methyltransferase [Pyrinomonadaceae bacterium]|nr:class I SAM-dependent methyltransferase [Pyrinomonadaceae bacterium]